MERIRVSLRSGTGAAVLRPTDKCKNFEFVIGADYEYWWEVLDALFHETMEYCLDQLGCRFRKTNSMDCAHSNYNFIFDHLQFTEASARASYFMAESIPDVCTAWKKWHKKVKGKK